MKRPHLSRLFLRATGVDNTGRAFDRTFQGRKNSRIFVTFSCRRLGKECIATTGTRRMSGSMSKQIIRKHNKVRPGSVRKKPRKGMRYDEAKTSPHYRG